MRLRSISFALFNVSLFVATASSPRALGQSASSQSTIRLASAIEPADSDPPPARDVSPQGSELNFEVPQATAAARPQAAPVQPRPVRTAGYMAPIAEPQSNLRSRSIVGVYSSASAQATLSKMPHPMPVQPASAGASTQASRSRGKPFQTIETDPTVSPYLNLYQTNLNPNTMPNYYALVRPQFEQLEANRKQTADVQKLRAQLQNANQRAGSQQPATTGTTADGMAVSARYMDTAQFYKQPKKK